MVVILPHVLCRRLFFCPYDFSYLAAIAVEVTRAKYDKDIEIARLHEINHIGSFVIICFSTPSARLS